MKQLLIVNSGKALNAGTSVTAYDFSGLDKGAISFFECGGDTAASTLISGLPVKNFGIALGRGANKPAFIIPEVDISTLEISHVLPQAGATFAASFTMPTTVVGKEYTIILCKKGALPHERNLFTTSIVAGSTTAATEATALRAAVNAKTSEQFPFVASGSSTTVTLTCQVAGQDWEIKFADALAGTTTSSITHGKRAIGDKAFMLDLQQRCAAGKGFVYLDGDSRDINPGFPEDLEGDWTMNTSGSGSSSTTGYKLFNLHFATKRVAGKTGDEQVFQDVIIAIPLTKADGTTAASALSSLNTILPAGKFPEYLTKAAADAAYAAKN